MKISLHSLCLTSFLALILGGSAHAFEENFDAVTELPAGFKVAKGEWKVVDGALVGAELGADHHAAALGFGPKNTDSEIRFRFRFDGADFLHVSLNHAKGHLFRVIFAPDTGVSITKDKDKKDPASKAIKLGARKGPISKGEWHDVVIKISGKNVSATIDDGQAVDVSHPGLATEKTGYRLIVKGSSVAIDDIKITAAQSGR